MIQFLLAFTFVYSVLRFLSFLKIFGKYLVGFFESLTPKDEVAVIWRWLDIIIFYAGLIFQAWYWLFRNVNL